jgi:hypothetical protein
MYRLKVWVEKDTSVPGSMLGTGLDWAVLGAEPCVVVVVVPSVAVLLRSGMGKCPEIAKQVELTSLVLWVGCSSIWAPKQEDGEVVDCLILKMVGPVIGAGSAEEVVLGKAVVVAVVVGGGRIHSPCMKVQQKVCWACTVVGGRRGLNPFGCCGNL